MPGKARGTSRVKWELPRRAGAGRETGANLPQHAQTRACTGHTGTHTRTLRYKDAHARMHTQTCWGPHACAHAHTRRYTSPCTEIGTRAHTLTFLLCTYHHPTYHLFSVFATDLGFGRPLLGQLGLL